MLICYRKFTYLDKNVVRLHFYLDKNVVRSHFYRDNFIIEIFFVYLQSEIL